MAQKEFNIWRDEKFDEALVAFEVKETGRKGGYASPDVLFKVVREDISLLDELDEHMKEVYGRGLEADDFCRLSPGKSGIQVSGSSVLTFSNCDVFIPTMYAFLKKKNLTFTSDALLIPREWSENVSPLGRAVKNSSLHQFLDQDYWRDHTQVLRDVLEHPKFSEQMNFALIKVAIEKCLSDIGEKNSIKNEGSPMKPLDGELIPLDFIEDEVKKALSSDNPLALIRLGDKERDAFVQFSKQVMTESLDSISETLGINKIMAQAKEVLEKTESLIGIRFVDGVAQLTSDTTPKQLEDKTAKTENESSKGFFSTLFTSKSKEIAVVSMQQDQDAQKENTPRRIEELMDGLIADTTRQLEKSIEKRSAIVVNAKGLEELSRRLEKYADCLETEFASQSKQKKNGDEENHYDDVSRFLTQLFDKTAGVDVQEKIIDFRTSNQALTTTRLSEGLRFQAEDRNAQSLRYALRALQQMGTTLVVRIVAAQNSATNDNQTLVQGIQASNRKDLIPLLEGFKQTVEKLEQMSNEVEDLRDKAYKQTIEVGQNDNGSVKINPQLAVGNGGASF